MLTSKMVRFTHKASKPREALVIECNYVINKYCF